MGSAVTAKCKCGYEETFMIGGGMRTFTTFCAFPALCKKCNHIVEANLLAKRPKCPLCRSTRLLPYDHAELQQERGRHCVAEWRMEERLGRTLELTDGRYYCPLCESFNLTFESAAIRWD